MEVVRKEQLPRIGSSWNFAGADHGGVTVSIYLVDAQPGKGAPLHCHDYDEVILIQEGLSRFVAGDSVHEAGPGSIIPIKAGTPHGFVNAGPVILRQVDIHSSPRFAQRNLPPTAVSRAAGLPE
jgi:quercetin dioxygenase-like cupin family protein